MTSASKTSATRRCPKAASTRRSATFPSPISSSTIVARRFSLHDFFFAKSIDALRPGGILALVTSHYTLDKQNAAIREYLASKADFVGAIRLPSDAFKREGTAVVTDILFLRKRAAGEPARHVDPDWLGVAPLSLDGVNVSINRYFLNHPEMVLGLWSAKDTLYGGEGYSVISDGDLRQQLQAGHRPFAPIREAGANERRGPSRSRRSFHRRLSGTSPKAAFSLATMASSTNRKLGKACPSFTAAANSGPTER